MLTQYKLARNLTADEKQAFLDGFYREWKQTLNIPTDLTTDTNRPWGCIWSHGAYGSETIVDCYSLETLELQGIKYFNICKNEILEELEQSK